MTIQTVTFEVAGARYDGGELNYKYIDSSTDFDEAKLMYKRYAEGYPYHYLRCVFYDREGRRGQELTIFGEPAESEFTEPPPWTAIHDDFEQGLLTWTQVFEALMVECRMPMDDALRCMAEHFDHRQPIIVEEVKL